MIKGKKRKVAAATGCSGSEPWIRQRQQRTWAFGREEGGTDDAAQHKASTPARPLWRVLAMVDSTSFVSSVSKALQVASTDQAFPQNHCDKHPTQTGANAGARATTDSTHYRTKLRPLAAHVPAPSLPTPAPAQARKQRPGRVGKGGEGKGERGGHRSPLTPRAAVRPKMLRLPKFLMQTEPPHRGAPRQPKKPQVSVPQRRRILPRA